MQACAIIETGWAEPAQVLSAFAEEPYAIGFLSGGAGPRARWSYLARRPDAVLTLFADDPCQPFAALAELIGPLAPTDPDGPPFQGGVAGLAAYELADRTERLDLERQAGWPDLACARYPAVLAFDHPERRVLAVGRGATAAAASQRADEALSWLSEPRPALRNGPVGEGLRPLVPAEDYAAAVAEVIARIGAGEIFQANIARPWVGQLAADAAPFDLLARLITDSPAPFAAYLRLADRAVVSNSPERFVQVLPAAGGFTAETRPIKGTRPRAADPAEDERLAAELLASAKDRAENLMIVDLMRNDLSRVCGKVETRELFRLESFTNVHHLVSTVTGKVRAGLSGLDVMAAAFPPGSVTGAPKIQAMKVIAELEPPRGPYCGSMFWAGFDGALDASVLIRTAALTATGQGWRLEARAGAGIVADSDPDAEALETSDKIAALAAAMGGLSS